MELSQGFKLTEIGTIPDDWDVTTVGREYSVQLGKMLDAARNSGLERPYVGNRAVQWGHVDVSDLPTVKLSRKEMDKFRLVEGDILVCEGGEVGRAAIWNAPIEECYYQKALHRLRPIGTFEPKLFVAILRQWSKRGLLANFVTQTSIAHLPREKFLQVPIPKPPPEEQRAIASVLTDADRMLDVLARLIAKKRDLKHAVMQRLLSGRIRLPGFTAAWKQARLGDHVEFLKNGAFSRANLVDAGNVKYLHYGDIHVSTAVRLSPSQVAMPCLPEPQARRLDRLTHGDLVFVDASEDRDGIGKSMEIIDSEGTQVVAGLHTIAARFDKTVLADGFKAYLQYCPPFASHLRRLAAGTKVYATTRAHIASVEMSLPSPEEQTAIATVLSDMDAELAALAARLEKTRALKQAMMQELLTGRTRLAAAELAHA